MRPPLLSDFISAFGDDPMVLPDGHIPRSTRADFSTLLALVSREGWDAAWNSDGRTVVLSGSRDPESFALRPIPGVQINWYPGEDELLFDIDLREYTSQEALDSLCAVIERIGAALSLPVLLSAEGDFDDVVVRYAPQTGEFSLRQVG